MKKLLFILLLLSLFSNISAQENNGIIPDSLILMLQKSTKKDTNRVKALEAIVLKYYESGQYELANNYLDEIENIAKTQNNGYAKLVLNYFELYKLYTTNKLFENVYFIYEIQNEMANYKDDDDINTIRFKTYILIFKYFNNSLMMPQAYNCLVKCQELNKKLNEKNFDKLVNHNLILFYMNINDLNECINVGRKAIEKNIYEKTSSSNIDYMIYSNVAMAYIGLQKYDSAQIYIDSAEIMTQNFKYLWDIMLKKGLICYEKGDYEKALEFSKNALKQQSETNSVKTISAYEIMAKAYNKIGEQDSAISLINKALELTKDMRNINYEKMILHDKTEILYSCGRCDEVIENMILTDAIDDSLSKLRDIENVDRMRLQQKMSEYDAKFKYENYIHEQKQRIHTIILIFILLILFMSVVLLVMIMRKRKLRHKKTEEELEQRNRDMASSVVVMMKKNDVINQVLRQLKDIKNASEEKNTKAGIAKVYKKIEKTMDENFYEEFDISFRRVHPYFIDTLMKNHPDLTPNEVRICSFLKLNMSTKDIASLTGQSVATIEMARFRLRRKFGLPMDEHVHLSNFIAKI